jgi:hypothetical protein
LYTELHVVSPLAASNWGGPKDFARSKGPKQCLRNTLVEAAPLWLTRRVPDLVELMTVHDSQLN